MSIDKLAIKYEKYKVGNFIGKLEALFNPSQLSFNKKVHWVKDNPLPEGETQSWATKYDHTDAETLTVSLFFDVYEEVGKWKSNPLWMIFMSKPTVLDYTKTLAELARFDEELHQPPTCKLQWGKVKLFTGVLTDLKQTYTMFLDDGTPVRATADCTFMEVAMDSDATRYELHSPDVDKTYVVRPGDTLDAIAANLYEDRKHWRAIAEANRIDNPRILTPGQILHIPKLR